MGIAVHMIFLAIFKVRYLSSHDYNGDVECRRDTLIEATEGQQLNLRSSVLRGCFFVFQHPEEGFECCYGNDKVCDLKVPHRQNESRCQNISVDSKYSLKCSAFISNVIKSHAGLYKVFNTDGDLIQACHLVVLELKTNPWRVAFLVLNSLTVLLLIYLTFRFVTKRISVSDEKQKGLYNTLKFQLYKN